MKTLRVSQPDITRELNKLLRETQAANKPARISALVSAILDGRGHL